MKQVYFATRLRGFFRQLFNSSYLNVKFKYNDMAIYETNSLWVGIKNCIGRSWILDKLGIIQIVHSPNISEDIVGSFNRFLNTKKPYFIYVENPTALFHYRLARGKSILGRRKIQKELNSPYLKGLIFMSKACENTFEQICGKIPSTCHRETIYPLIPENPKVNEGYLKRKCYNTEFKLLYVVQGKRFISKGGLEVVAVLQKLRQAGNTITLHIITSVDELPKNTISKLLGVDGIIIDDFRFSFKELQEIYRSSHLLLQPTSDESFGLTILEAMKSGLPVIASKLYSIPELISDDINGYLCEPHYWFFDKNNIPNPKIWNHRASTIYSGEIDENIITFLFDKITTLYNNRDLLYNLSINSLNRSSEAPLSEMYIAQQWNSFFDKL